MLTKSPDAHNSFVYPVRYFGAARQAFSAILASLEFNADKRLLLPAYIGITEREGSGVYDPVQKNLVPHDFYSLNERLGAIEDELCEMIESGKYRALLVIHYFGFCQNRMSLLIDLCRENDVLLIEDCAHTMLSAIDEGELGCLGDFSFYSIHKYLPSRNGGCLKVNNEKYLKALRLSRKGLEPPTAETLDVVLKSDLEAIRIRRRRNYTRMLELLRPVDGIELMFEQLAPGIAPHNFPIIVGENRREEIYFKLIEKGVPAIALYYRMISPITEGDFPNSLKVSNNILNLPVHQDVSIDELEFVAEKLVEALSS